jgi:hypothetical protein
MKSHHQEADEGHKLREQRATLLKSFVVLKALGEKPSKHMRVLVRLIDLKLEWLTKNKLARTKLMKYDRKIKRLQRKLNHES